LEINGLLLNTEHAADRRNGQTLAQPNGVSHVVASYEEAGTVVLNAGNGVTALRAQVTVDVDAPEATIDFDDFCAAVAEYGVLRDVLIAGQYKVEQIKDAIGGIANLYLGKLIRDGSDALSMCTANTFASPGIPLAMITSEIEHSAGTKAGTGMKILLALQDEFLKYFPTEGTYVTLHALGHFRLMDRATHSYQVTYKDPSAEHYHKFLY
jgi:hypothetical protein